MLFMTLEGPKRHRQPPMRWIDPMIAFLEKMLGRKVCEMDVINVAKNQECWKQMEDDFCRHSGDPLEVA